MPIIKKPFECQTLDEDRTAQKPDIFSIRLNPAEREVLNKIKKYLDVGHDGKALKIGSHVGLKVLLSLFGADYCRYLFKKDRVRFDDPKDKKY